MVVGAGLGGCCMALALSSIGIQSTVFEMRKSRENAGGGIVLSPNALRVLDHLGLYESLKGCGFSFDDISFIDTAGSLIGRYANGSKEKYGYPALSIPRSTLHGILLDRCHKSKNVEILYDHKVISVREDENSVTLSFQDCASATADVALGADGVFSKVRKHVIENVMPTYNGLTAIGGILQRDEIPSIEGLPLPNFIIGKEGSLSLFPQDSEQKKIGWLVYLEISEPDRVTLEGFAANDGLTLLREKFRDWPDPVQTIIREAKGEDLFSWVQHSIPISSTWHTKRVLIVGDAAHAMSATSGQSGAQAFEDAATLVKLISENHTVLQNPEHLFKAFCKLRSERLQTVTKFAKTSGLAVKKANALLWPVKKYGMWAFFGMLGGKNNAALYAYNVNS